MISRFLALKRYLVRQLAPIGGYQLCRLFTRNNPRILMYHRFSAYEKENRVSQNDFEKQVQELKSNFNVVPLSSLITHLVHNKSLPPNSIVITIDDGYLDFYEYAYPILKNYDIPATIYITADFVDKRIWLWPDKVSYLLNTTPHDSLVTSIKNQNFSFELKTEFDSCWKKIIDYCIELDNKARNNFINDLADSLDVSLPDSPTTEYAALEWRHIVEMSTHGIEIGAHTMTHPILSKLSSQELEYEIVECKNLIEQKTGLNISCFCYPNGQKTDFTVEVKTLIQKNGYTNATVAFNDEKEFVDLFELRRHAVSANEFQFKKAISGMELLSHKLKGMLAF